MAYFQETRPKMYAKDFPVANENRPKSGKAFAKVVKLSGTLQGWC